MRASWGIRGSAVTRGVAERADLAASSTDLPSVRSFLASMAVAFLPALIGVPFVDRDWYRSLDRPRWSPPSEVFGPVWTFLYASLGLAAWVAWRRQPRPVGALLLYLVQLALNAIWTPVFFGARKPGAALVVIVALWVASLATAIGLFRARAVAGLLLIPYLAWVAFAALLNGAIWRRSRESRRP
jgi:tryptophan-rich sensory protein